MPQPRTVRCPNCGTNWLPPARTFDSRSVAECPVCQLPVAATDATPQRAMSANELTVQLGALISSARAGGLDDAVIVQKLRDELEFAAEMAHVGRRFCVQLIDLGPQESSILQRPIRDRRESMQQRRVG